MSWKEKDLHLYLSKVFPFVGDDAALVKVGSKKLALSCDALEEELHFSFAWMSLDQLAHKLVAVNVSDLAAMGAKPLWAVLSLALPKNTPFLKVKQFFQALKKACQKYKIVLLGGDSDASDKWRLSLTVIGETNFPVSRKNAQVGDDLWISGKPGYSALGLHLLQNDLKAAKYKIYIQKHLNPKPHVNLAWQLCEQKLIHSLIDVSDGLYLDLERLCSASHVSCKIHLPSLKWPKEFVSLKHECIASGGEDYELLFSASPKCRSKIEKVFKKFKVDLHHLGKVSSQLTNKKASCVIVEDEMRRVIKFAKKGYQHF